MGPFSKALGAPKFLLVAINKFTRRFKAMPIRKITAAATVKAQASAGNVA